MGKKLRDLEVGDIVWIIDGFDIVQAYVKENRMIGFHIYILLIGYIHPFVSYYPGAKRIKSMFLEYEDALEHLKKKSGKRKQTLEKKIDSLVSEFDALDSLITTTVKPSTKSPSMKELKLKDSVWYVDKFKLKVRKTRILEIQKKAISWDYYIATLRIKTPISSFLTYPNASRSTRLDYYTTEEQAWRYMLEWKKSRMKTVGNEMEKLMKELEKIERNEE
jgi:hypothetical protein